MKKVRGKLLRLSLKNEGHDDEGRIIGPVYMVFEQLNPDYRTKFLNEPVDTILENLENGEPCSYIECGYYPRWFNYKEAKEKAQELGVKLELM